MNSIPEETGKVATSAIEAFKNNPACLAAILLSFAFGVLTFYGLQRDADRRAKTVDTLLERCYPYIEEHQNRQYQHPQEPTP